MWEDLGKKLHDKWQLQYWLFFTIVQPYLCACYSKQEFIHVMLLTFVIHTRALKNIFNSPPSPHSLGPSSLLVLFDHLPHPAPPGRFASCSADREVHRVFFNLAPPQRKSSCTDDCIIYYLPIFIIDLLRLHGLFCLIRLDHLNQGSAGHDEDSVDVHSDLDFHLGALTGSLRDNFLNQKLTYLEKKCTGKN